MEMQEDAIQGMLYAALSKAQSEIKHATRDATNPYYRSRYADLASVWDVCRAPLTKHGLAVIQTTRVVDGKNVLVTRLVHESGASVVGEVLLRPMRQKKDEGWIDSEDPQSIGSAITYARRYALAAIVGVATEDDDAEAATGRGQTAQAVTIPGGAGGSRPAQAPESGQVADKKAAPAPYSADDENSMRGRLVDLSAVWANHKKITVPDAIKEFSIFHSKDRKTKALAYKSDGSPLWAFKTEAKDLTGKWLLIALEKAKELTKDLVHEEDNMIPPDLFPET